MTYYNIEQTIQVIQKTLPEAILLFDLPQLVDLCNAGKLTPVVYYELCLDSINRNDFGNPLVNPYLFKGYLAADEFRSLLTEYSYLEKNPNNQLYRILYFAEIYETIESSYSWDIYSGHNKQFSKNDRVALFHGQSSLSDPNPRNLSDQTEKDSFTVTPTMLKFSSQELEEYLRLPIEQYKQDKQQIENLETTIESLQGEMEKLRNQLKPKVEPLAQELDDKSEVAYLNTIGLLLKVMQEPRWAGDNGFFQSEAKIILSLLNYDIYGQRKTSLENRFKNAKRSLEEANKSKINFK